MQTRGVGAEASNTKSDNLARQNTTLQTLARRQSTKSNALEKELSQVHL